jgi:hypothetical protein
MGLSKRKEQGNFKHKRREALKQIDQVRAANIKMEFGVHDTYPAASSNYFAMWARAPRLDSLRACTGPWQYLQRMSSVRSVRAS